MDEQELEKQFEATDYDEDGNIKQTPPPPAAAKKKRVTVADLNKAIDDIRDVKFPETFNWIGEVDARTDTLEQIGLEHIPQFITDTNEHLQKLEKSIPILQHNQGELMKVFKAVQKDVDALQVATVDTDINARLNDLETGYKTIVGPAHNELSRKIDALYAATNGIGESLVAHIEESATQQPEPKPELLFAQPPMIPERIAATKGDLEAVAAVCQTMADVLMICRALKAAKDLTDEDRLYILQVACRMAGELITNGLKIRAGIKYVAE